MSTASQLFDWPTASAALEAGWRVRRIGWTDQNQWLERWTGGLIWLIPSTGAPRVVQNTDFGADEFAALDWTNLPATCITSGTTAGTGVNGCPLPFSPSAQQSGASSSSTSVLPDLPISPGTPPSSSPGAGQVGVGSGGSSTRSPSAPRSAPSLALTLYDTSEGACYPDDGTQPYANIGVSFVLTGDPSFGLCLVRLFIGTVQILSEWHTPTTGGTSGGTTWTGPISPGGTLTFNGRVWSDGAPDAFASASINLKKFCDSVTITASVSGRWGGTSGESFAVLLDGGPIGSVDGTGAGKTFNVRCAPGNHTATIPIFDLPPGTVFDGPGNNTTGTTFGSAAVGVTDYSGTSLVTSGRSDGVEFTMP